MKQCFGYVRVSTQKQGEGVSLEAQKEAISDFAARNNITIIKWFEEKQTAAKRGRPEFNSMIKALRLRAAAGVVIHKIDRGARNFFDYGRLGELSDAGIDVHFAVESLDFKSRGGRLAANVQMAVAEDYCRNLREEIRKGQLTQLKRGLYPFYAPLGYRNNGKGKLKTIDPERGSKVKEAFELYASGQYSIRSLVAEVNRRGLRNNGGQRISKTCLERFLGNPFYTGIIHIRRTGEVYQGAHKPLISATLFATVEDIKAGRYHKKITRHNHTYRGLFRCAQCGYSMVPEKHKGHVYYRCQKQDCHPTNNLREERLEDAVRAVLEHVRMTTEQLHWLEQQFMVWWKKRRSEKDVRTIAVKQAQIKQRIDRLTDAFLDDCIDKAVFNERRQSLLVEQARLAEEEQKARETRLDFDQVRAFLELIKSLAGHYICARPEEKREIVEIATLNRKVATKDVYLEPSNWLLATETLLTGFSCAHSTTTSCTADEFKVADKAIGDLVEAVSLPEVAKLIDQFRK